MMFLAEKIDRLLCKEISKKTNGAITDLFDCWIIAYDQVSKRLGNTSYYAVWKHNGDLAVAITIDEVINENQRKYIADYLSNKYNIKVRI